MHVNDLSANQKHENAHFAANVLVKAFLLFLLANLLCIILNPYPVIGKISAYNKIFPGRMRLPYGDNPQKSYNLSLYNLDAMFASHEIASKVQQQDVFRVVVIGDSAAWGFFLPPEKTLAAYLNQADIHTEDGRPMRFYNLGYPVMSLMKDLLILSRAMQYDPDLIVWPLTLESFPYDKQLFPPLLQNNLIPVQELVQTYKLNVNLPESEPGYSSIWQRTLVGTRRNLADLVRLQFYGVMWAATGIDQDIPSDFTTRMEDLPEDQIFHNLEPPYLDRSDLAFDILAAGVSMAGEIPILFINEPMFISQGQNSDIRYNYYYPRWVYDDYRNLLQTESQERGWYYLDMWNVISPKEFTNTAVHLSSLGTQQFAQLLRPYLEKMVAEDFPKIK